MTSLIFVINLTLLGDEGIKEDCFCYIMILFFVYNHVQKIKCRKLLYDNYTEEYRAIMILRDTFQILRFVFQTKTVKSVVYYSIAFKTTGEYFC